ncbi:hypothetical protein BC936DRAFT_144082, partial [Jimgerdemannia flammicorona]
MDVQPVRSMCVSCGVDADELSSPTSWSKSASSTSPGCGARSSSRSKGTWRGVRRWRKRSRCSGLANVGLRYSRREKKWYQSRCTRHRAARCGWGVGICEMMQSRISTGRALMFMAAFTGRTTEWVE